MYKLVWSPRQSHRVYKFDTPLVYIPRPYSTAKEYWDVTSKRYEIETIKGDTLNFVCVSDAVTHIERLVFAVTKCSKTDEWIMPFDDIAGKHGWMTGLGETKIYNDEVYLRYLIIYDKKQKGLKGE